MHDQKQYEVEYKAAAFCGLLAPGGDVGSVYPAFTTKSAFL